MVRGFSYLYIDLVGLVLGGYTVLVSTLGERVGLDNLAL